MTGSTMGSSVAAPAVRLMINADGVIGANTQALQSTAKDMGKSGSSRYEPAERSLGTRAGGVN